MFILSSSLDVTGEMVHMIADDSSKQTTYMGTGQNEKGTLSRRSYWASTQAHHCANKEIKTSPLKIENFLREITLSSNSPGYLSPCVVEFLSFSMQLCVYTYKAT
jgi:hypothetical protein